MDVGWKIRRKKGERNGEVENVVGFLASPPPTLKIKRSKTKMRLFQYLSLILESGLIGSEKKMR